MTVVGFVAARWRRADLDQLHEWGLGGRRFGTLVTWFLLGGDLYTAYTFVAVPALVYGAGALGFFAMPYTVITYPFVFVVMPRLWSVSHKHGYITAADFVRGRFDSGALALAVAVTGILATMPYIALQLVGIQVVLGAMGIQGDLPLLIAFGILAVYTYQSGLRAPALIAVVKDAIIYVTVIAAVIVVPLKLGGYGAVFDAVPAKKLILAPEQFTAYSTLALGSALALFLYPHSMTGVLSSSGRAVIRRNTAMLPAYSFLLGLIALLGYMAIAAKVGSAPAYAAGFAQYGANFAVPALFLDVVPGMVRRASLSRQSRSGRSCRPPSCRSPRRTSSRATSTASSSGPTCSGKEESTVAKVASLVVKFGALAFIVRRCRRSTRSRCSCSGACGSCRRSRPSSWVSTRAGCTAGGCSPAGRWEWPGHVDGVEALVQGARLPAAPRARTSCPGTPRCGRSSPTWAWRSIVSVGARRVRRATGERTRPRARTTASRRRWAPAAGGRMLSGAVTA